MAKVSYSDFRESGGSMDFNKAIRELYEQKKSLDRAIARLESRLAAMPKRSTRGRKSMSAEERLKVSARMTAYWAARRAQIEEPAQMAAKESEPSGEPEPETGANEIIA